MRSPLLSRFAVLLLLPGPARVVHAQAPALETLTVKVRAEGEPIVGATVRVGPEQAKTDASGQATLRLMPGDHDITVEADGFVPAVSHAALTARTASSVTVDLTALKEQIFVSATRSATRLEAQPLRVEVIDREGIEEKALMTPGSVAMLLGETTGLRVQVTAPSMGASNVRIQGLRGHYSQLLADGLPLYGAQGDSFSLLQVPPLDLGQVEVIKGVASALYGTSAIGGVRVFF